MTTIPEQVLDHSPHNAPGLYPGLTFVEYHAIDAVNHSSLEGFKRTPAHARERMVHPEDSTPELALGHAFHVFALEPDRFPLEYAVAPECDRRTKVGKAVWEEFETANPGRLGISQAEFQRYARMLDALMEHETARAFLTNRGAAELTVVWLDEATGLRCKARLDRVSELADWPFIIDLKTTKDASGFWFARDIASYGYHRQLAWYRLGLAAVRPGQRRAAIVAVETKPPYCVAVHELEERALEQGEREARRHLETYAECYRSGVWPGYPEGLQLIDLPTWAVDVRE